MARKALLAWAYLVIAMFGLAMSLLYIVIPFGINLGKEREVRDFAVVIFVIVVLTQLAQNRHLDIEKSTT